jgi:alkylation response protein AidB-like acyl-CoA dehydrogenase
MTEEQLRQRALDLVGDCDPHRVDQFAFRGEQYDRGLAWVHFPEGKGGLGLPRSGQAVVQQVLRAAGSPYHDLFVNPIGIGMAAPTLLTFGSEELQDRHLRSIFTGEDVWCQLFSEPGYGSDLAGLASRAVRAGEDWIVNGQKVWTTLAHVASYGLMLARTDPDVPKRRGLSYFVVDMNAPGVECRALFQMTGEAEFNEVFFTDVRVPDVHRLGDEGAGWKVANTTLMNERVSIGGAGGGRGSGAIRHLIRVWSKRCPDLSAGEQAAWRDRVVSLWARVESQRLTNSRARAQAKSGTPGPEGSVAKLVYGEINQRIFEAAVDLLAAEGMLHSPGYPMERVNGVQAIGTRDTSWEFLRSRAASIEGGTSEILRNVLGERVLGLPGDVRVDTDVPWSSIGKQTS